MKKLLPFLTFLIFSLFATNALAQEERCTQNLEEAQLRYDEGRIQDVEPLVLNCLETNVFDKAQSVQALRLLILSAIFQHRDEQADDMMLDLLQTDHEFVPDEALDPVDFINLYNSYRTKPIFSLGIKGGQNWSFNDVQQMHTVGQQGWKKEYSIINGLQAGLLFEYEFKPRWILYPEIHYSQKRYTKEEIFMGIVSNTEISTSKIEEVMNWIELPVSVQYIFTNSAKFKPYAFAGGAVTYLISAEYPGDNTIRERLGTGSSQVQLATIITKNDRNRLNFNALGGAGIKLKVGEGYFTVEARFNYQLTTLTVDGNGLTATDEPDLAHGLWEWYDSFKQHSALIMLGYTLNIYNPEKLQAK